MKWCVVMLSRGSCCLVATFRSLFGYVHADDHQKRSPSTLGRLKTRVPTMYGKIRNLNFVWKVFVWKNMFSVFLKMKFKNPKDGVFFRDVRGRKPVQSKCLAPFVREGAC